MEKKYLGDAVYAETDGFGIGLTTEDGISTTNRIYLEPQVYHALVAYAQSIQSDPQLSTDHARLAASRWGART